MTRTRPMLVSASIVLGALSTLTVAWACAAWVNMHGAEGQLTSNNVRDGVWDTTYVQKRFGHTRINFMRGVLYVDMETWILWSDAARRVPGASDDHAIQQQMLAGWPWRAFRCEREGVEISIPSKDINVGGIGGRTARGIELRPVGGGFWRALPYDPIWFGLIANTIAYGAVWWLILITPVALRRYLRRRRGLCPMCAYDLRGDLPRGCPECGWGRPFEEVSS